MEPEIALLLILIILSGFFSGAEIALFSLSNAKLRTLLEQNEKNAKLLERVKSQPQKLLITILIANNFINIGASSLATVVAINRLGSAGAGIATGIMTFLILFFGEIIPKSIAQQNPVKVGLKIAPAMRVIMAILLPLAWFMDSLTKLVQKAFGLKDIQLGISEEDVKALVNLGHEEGSFRANEKRMIEKVFLLDDITAEDVMTPAEYIVGFDVTQSLDEALPVMMASGHSRFPVYTSNHEGDVAGVLYVKDVFKYIAEQLIENSEHPEQVFGESVTSFVQPALFVPETIVIDQLLKDFQSKRRHIAVVVDEHGSIQGIVTLEDLLEEIVGEIIDETDVDENLIKRIDEKTVLVDPRISVHKINVFFNSKLKAQRQKTIGWLVLKHFGRIPDKGDSVDIDDYKFIVEEAEDHRIKRLLMIKTPKAKQNEKKK